MLFLDAFGEKKQSSSKRTVALCNTTTERHLTIKPRRHTAYSQMILSKLFQHILIHDVNYVKNMRYNLVVAMTLI